MPTINLKSLLELNSIWKDEHMFEFKVIVLTKTFFGETKVYDQYKLI
jgi:hypothetical protein